MGKYHVVEFIEEKKVSHIPDVWLLYDLNSNPFSWWPAFITDKAIEQAKETGLLPNSGKIGWSKYRVRILCGPYG